MYLPRSAARKRKVLVPYQTLMQGNTPDYASPPMVHLQGKWNVTQSERKIEHSRQIDQASHDNVLIDAVLECFVKVEASYAATNAPNAFSQFYDILAQCDSLWSGSSTTIPMKQTSPPIHLKPATFAGVDPEADKMFGQTCFLEDLKLSVYVTLLHKLIATQLSPNVAHLAVQLLNAVVQKLYLWVLPVVDSTWGSMSSRLRGYLSLVPAYSAAHKAYTDKNRIESDAEGLAAVVKSWSLNHMRAQILRSRVRNRWQTALEAVFSRKVNQQAQRSVFREWRIITKFARFERRVAEAQKKIESYTKEKYETFEVCTDHLYTFLRRLNAQITFTEGLLIKSKEENSSMQSMVTKSSERLRVAEERASIAVEKSLTHVNLLQRAQIEMDSLSTRYQNVFDQLEVLKTSPWRPFAVSALKCVAELGEKVSVPEPMLYAGAQTDIPYTWYLVREWANDCVQHLGTMDGMTGSRLKGDGADARDCRFLARLLYYLALPRFINRSECAAPPPFMGSQSGEIAREALLGGRALLEPLNPSFMQAFGDVIDTSTSPLIRADVLLSFATTLLVERPKVEPGQLITGNISAVQLLFSLLYAKFSTPLHHVPASLWTAYRAALTSDAVDGFEESDLMTKAHRIMMTGTLWTEAETPETIKEPSACLRTLKVLQRSHRECVYRVLASVADGGGGGGGGSMQKVFTVTDMMAKETALDLSRLSAISCTDTPKSLCDILLRYKPELMSIYIRYCEDEGEEGGECLRFTFSRWVAFTNGCKLGELSNSESLQEIFVRSSIQSTRDDSGLTILDVYFLDPSEFCEAMLRLARLFEPTTKMLAKTFIQFMEECILPRAIKTQINAARAILLEPDVQKVVAEFQTKLRDMYNALTKASAESSSQSPGVPPSALHSFMKGKGIFTSDFTSDLVDDIIAKLSKGNGASLSFQLFVDILGIIALCKYSNILLPPSQRVVMFLKSLFSEPKPRRGTTARRESKFVFE